MRNNILPDVLRRDLRAVISGTAAGKASARRRAYYAGPGNKFWQSLRRVGLTPHVLKPQEFRELLGHGIGLTDQHVHQLLRHGNGLVHGRRYR